MNIGPQTAKTALITLTKMLTHPSSQPNLERPRRVAALFNKTDAGNGSNGTCRVIDASRSPSPDPKRSPNQQHQSPCRQCTLFSLQFSVFAWVHVLTHRHESLTGFTLRHFRRTRASILARSDGIVGLMRAPTLTVIMSGIATTERTASHTETLCSSGSALDSSSIFPRREQTFETYLLSRPSCRQT